MSTREPPPSGTIDASRLVGTVVADRFRVQRVMSEGANTNIVDAADAQSGRVVTLKLVHPSLSASPTFRNRFDETMRAAAALSHPNIAAVFDWGVARVGESSTAYVVIEQLTGGSLRDLFDRGRRLTPSQALAIGLDACRGLDYAHRRGIVHTELTPSKLVFGDDRRLRIVDFGLAQLLGERAWAQPDSVPNHVAWYAAPEQGQSLPVDGKADVYALALTLHEGVTGTLPFRDDSTVASLAARVGRLMPVSADLGPLAAVLERAGRPDADDRASAAEFGQALVQAASKLPRPDPLPILSSGLFDTPPDQLRGPDDPTGGVVRPGDTGAPPVVVVPAAPTEPDPDGPVADADEVVAPDAPDGDESMDADADADVAGALDGSDDGAVATTEIEATPHGDADETADGPEPPVIVEGEPDAVIPHADPADALVILPLDRGIGPDDPADGGRRPPSVRSAAETQLMAAAAREAAPHRRAPRFPWKIVLSLLVVGALVVLAVLATQLFRTPVYTVPDLVSLPEAEARNLVATNGWEITVERERSDVVPEVGRVVRTSPVAGVDLAEGEPFLIVVSQGPTLRELPESTGVRLSEAETTLRGRGLAVQVVEAFDEVVSDDTVISWSVPGDPTLVAGAMVEPETVVELVVSAGPAPRVVPDVVGHTVGDARAELDALGLALDDSVQEFSDEVPPGAVIAQAIEPGTEVERGTTLAVIVSLGPDLVTFPDLSGANSFREAASVLAEAGFEPVLVFGDAEGAIRSVRIDGAEPEVGATFRRGTRVDIEAL